LPTKVAIAKMIALWMTEAKTSIGIETPARILPCSVRTYGRVRMADAKADKKIVQNYLFFMVLISIN